MSFKNKLRKLNPIYNKNFKNQQKIYKNTIKLKLTKVNRKLKNSTSLINLIDFGLTILVYCILLFK